MRMSTTYDDSVLDFDLNFLNQDSNSTTISSTTDHDKYEKQKRNMTFMKKKVVSTNSLISKYYSKKNMLSDAEKNLVATKEECKQICLDYRNALEKTSILENESLTVHKAYKNVDNRCGKLENQCEALQSHIHQLQQLIKEKDSALDSLRVEKYKTINMKEFDRKVSLLERDKTSLNKDVMLFAELIKKILGKRKLKEKYNNILRKYDLHSDGNNSDNSDVYEEPFSPPLADIIMTKKSSNLATDSDCDYSIDTGRGSSVASDNEKFVLSPEYFTNDCSTTLVTIENRAKIKVTNVATSPIVFQETIQNLSLPLIDNSEEHDESRNKSNTGSQLSMLDRCLSPIRINNSRSVGTSPIEKATIVQIEIQNEFESKDASTLTDIQTLRNEFESKDAATLTDIQISQNKFESMDASTLTDIQTSRYEFESKDASTLTDIQASQNEIESKDASTITDIRTPSLSTMDRSISPINMTTSVAVFTSPMKCVTKDIATSPVISNENTNQNESTQDVHEKECLELNNSKNLRCDNHTDYEIEMILNTMQMNHDIITPIPRTPLRTRNSESRNVPGRLSRITDHSKIFECGILENDSGTSELDELKMELNNMKSILKQHILLTSKQLQFNHEPLISKLDTDNDHFNAIYCMDTNKNTLSESLLDGSEIQPEFNLEISQSGLVPSPIDNNLLFGSSQSLTERDADNVLDDNTTRTYFLMLQDERHPHHLEEEETTAKVNTETSKEISEDVNDFINPENCEELNEESVKVKVKKTKRNRLSKLDKLRKNLIPKYKIRSQTPSIVKSQLKSKLHNSVDRKITKNGISASLNDTSASLNDKHVYEKAVKIMTELNSKKSPKTRKTLSGSVNKSVVLATNEKSVNCNKTTQRLEVTQVSKVTSKPKKGALFEKQNTLLNDNITKVVPTKPQITSKEVVSPAKPPKPIRKKSLLSLSSLFEEHPDDIQTELVINTQESCKNLLLSKPTIDSISTSETSPSSVFNENSKSDNLTSKSNKDALLEKQAIPLDDNITEVVTTKPQITSKEVISPAKPYKPIRKKSCLPLSGLFEEHPVSDDEQTDLVINTNDSCKSPISSKPTKDPLSTSKTCPSSILHDNSKNGNQTPPQTSPTSKRSPKTQKSPSKPNKISLCSNDTRTGEDVSSSENCKQTSPKSQIATRSKSKFVEPCFVVLTNDPVLFSEVETKNSEYQKVKVESDIPNQQASRKRRNNSSIEPEIQCKRILRSSTVCQRLSTENKEKPNATCNKSMDISSADELKIKEIDNENPMKERKNINHDPVISYEDLDLFSDDVQSDKVSCQEKQPPNKSNAFHPKESILCCMLDKYGVENVRSFSKKIPDATVKTVSEKIEQNISNIIESSPEESTILLNRFVADLKKLNHKHFMAGLMKYLTKPERKIELFSKVVSSPAPPMTKAEQILIYVILHLKSHCPSVDIVDAILSNIEYTVFKLNRTPEFGVIESISHFYALLCRYFAAKSRLRLFILDAMYCIQFKSVPLIKQCLDVWMHIIPLAHMGIAKCPLVTCLVYLLHFYKCTDKFNRVQDIRNILREKFFYQITDWNESKILEMFKHSIKELKDVPIERKMLRLALIILAKRQGARWCQNQIIKNLLLPMIENQDVPDNVKEFCVSMIGPLMKPYPVDMKVNCEIVMNQLTEMLNKDPSQKMEEAIITSMMFINRHNQQSINKTLLSRKMKPLSSELEGILREYVRAMPLKVWKKNISQLAHNSKLN